MLRVEPRPTADDDPAADAPRAVRVLLLPDPSRQPKGDRPGPRAVANLARALVDQLQRQQPANEWRAEFDLERIPQDALCYELGEALTRLWDGTGPLPATFVVAESKEGGRRLRRRLVAGEPASMRFQKGYRRLLTSMTSSTKAKPPMMPALIITQTGQSKPPTWSWRG